MLAPDAGIGIECKHRMLALVRDFDVTAVSFLAAVAFELR